MKAVVITNFGGVEGLEVLDVPDPAPPTADRIRVRVRAAGLNRADLLQRKGHYPAPPGYPQDIPGLEFAGEVESVGPDARRWKVGQRVFGLTGGGAQAELVVVREDQLVEVPSNLDWAAAAAVPEVFITAHDALFTQANLAMGETVLVHAAGSGVGTAAVQLARAAGATVIGTSRHSEKLQKAQRYGLNRSIVVTNDLAVIVDSIMEWTNKGVDVVLDLVGAGYFEANVQVLAKKGRLLFIGTTSGSKTNLDLGTVMSKRLHLIGSMLRSRPLEEKALATRLFEAHVVPLLAAGTVEPVIDQVYKVDQIREAHKRLESNESFGKVIVEFD